jgi:hypothetical protein
MTTYLDIQGDPSTIFQRLFLKKFYYWQSGTHDYYSTYMVQSKRRLYIREKSRSHKTKNPLFHLVPCHEMLIIILNCSHIGNIIKYFLNNKIES